LNQVFPGWVMIFFILFFLKKKGIIEMAIVRHNFVSGP
jgi:hypothetical protein